MKRFYFCLVVIIVVALAMPAFGGVGQGLSGPHYNLNIIGVSKDKTVPSMTGSNRHTVFVPLNNKGDVQAKIYYQRAPEGEGFKVLDGNATDDGVATIQVPFEFCPEEDFPEGCRDLLSYDVYAVGLGKPNGVAVINAECVWENEDYGNCTDAIRTGSFTIKRSHNQFKNPNKPRRQDITDIFRADGCLDLDESGFVDAGDICFDDIWIFNIPELEEYWWNYGNDDLKLMQVRFYPTVSGMIWEVQPE